MVLGCKIAFNKCLTILLYCQHDEYDWFNEKALLLDDFIHLCSKNYFEKIIYVRCMMLLYIHKYFLIV